MTHDNTQSSFSFRSWFLVYTFLFLFISAIIWRPFYFEHKSMIWGYDGLYQTYGSMVYFSQYWRDFLINLCSGNPSLPMVDTSLGMGFDILTTLNYYGFGDPLELRQLFRNYQNGFPFFFQKSRWKSVIISLCSFGITFPGCFLACTAWE